MNKALAFITSLLAATPAMALTGHVIQVHHGTDCVEFAILEDANAVCGSTNVFLSNGTVNSACLANVPWYGIATGQGVGQAELTVGQLPFFIASTIAIDTAFQETQAVVGLEVGSNSAIGFTPLGSLTCKNIDAVPATHTVTSIGNINTPPGPNQ